MSKKKETPEEQQEFFIWPEWSESDVLAEKWGGKHVFEDPEGTVLPRCIRKKSDGYKRACDVAGDSVAMFVVQSGLDDLFLSQQSTLPDLNVKPDPRKSETSLGELKEKEVMFDTVVESESLQNGSSKLFYHNRHLLESDFYVTLLSCLHYFYDSNRLAKVSGHGEEFLPWDNIYPKTKDGLPAYNPSGKYMIKLFWLGCWRKVIVDDRTPIDGTGKPLLLSSPSPNEIWPLLISKALLKIANASFTEDSDISEFGDFDVITALRGWVPETITLSPTKSSMASSMISSLWVRKRMGSRELSLMSNVSTPVGVKTGPATTKPLSTVPTYFLYRSFVETEKIDYNLLAVVYRIIEIQDSMDDTNRKLYLVRPYFSSGSKQNDYPDQWITEDLMSSAFSRLVVYHPTQGYRLIKTIVNIMEQSKLNDLMKPAHVLFTPEEHTSPIDPGILILLSTFSKQGNATICGVSASLQIEEYHLGDRIEKVPVLRTFSNGYTGFFFKPQPGVGYRISLENATSYTLTFFSKEEFQLDEEPKYLTEKHGFRMKEFEDTLPPQQVNMWSILFKHIVNVTEPMQILSSLSIPEVMSMTTSVHIINNDDGLEVGPMLVSFSSHQLQPNKNGYTLYAQTRTIQARGPTKWKYRLFTNGATPSGTEKEYLSTRLNIQDFSETFVPNKYNLLFRNLLKVKDAPFNLVSLQTQFSHSNIWIKMQLFDNEVEIASAQGKGSVTIPNVALYLSDDPQPQKQNKEDKKTQNIPQPVIPPKHKYILQATILPSEIEKLHSASADSNRPNSRNLKSASSAGRKKRSTTQTPATPTVANPNQLNSPASTAPVETDFVWSLRVISSEAAPLIIQKDTEKEDRYKSIKDSWETAAPGRMNRAKEVRETYLRGVEAGSIRPVSVNYNDLTLKPWTVMKRDCPKVLVQRDRDIRTPDQKPSLLQKLLTKPTTPSQAQAVPEIKEEVPSFSVQCKIVGVCDSPIVLTPTDCEQNAQIRAKRLEVHLENHTENIKRRQSEREKRSFMKKKMIEVVEQKVRELEYWNKYDKDRREEYRQKLQIELEESNARLKAILDAQSKAAESAEPEEPNDKKKKAGKK